MKTCSLNDFLESVKPWLSDEYIRSVHLDENEDLILEFTDGVKNAYHIEDCDLYQIKEILMDFKKKGITIKQ